MVKKNIDNFSIKKINKKFSVKFLFNNFLKTILFDKKNLFTRNIDNSSIKIRYPLGYGQNIDNSSIKIRYLLGYRQNLLKEIVIIGNCILDEVDVVVECSIMWFKRSAKTF